MSLDPTLLHRLTDRTRPRWARTPLARRVTAGVLVALAAALAVRGDPSADRVPVVVASHDLQPGRVLTDADVRVAEIESRTLPDGAVSSPGAVVGRTLAGATRLGEALTDIRVLGPRLAAATIDSPDARIVPVRLADPSVTEMLREGDRVDVLTAGDDHDGAAVLARDAAVVLVSAADEDERVVLLALPEADAVTVAAASLVDSLTVVLH